jgi:hypothetical protein
VVEGRTTHCDTLGVLLTRVAEPLLLPFDSLSDLPSTRPSLLCSATPGVREVSPILLNLSRDSRLRGRRYDDRPQLFESHLARILVSFRQAASHHLATFILKVTVLVPPAFLMTNLYCPSFSGVNLTEHFGPDESSLATSAPVES